MKNNLKPVDKQNAKIKNLLGLNDNPTYEDLLFEIVRFLEDENRFDGEFKKGEISQKTKSRINRELSQDIKGLEDKGYVEHTKYTKYKVLTHPWEKNETYNQ